MKNQFLNVLACAAVLFLVSCSGNPTESPEYKAMISSYEAMVGEQTTAQGGLIAAQDATKKLMAALSGLGEEAGDMKGELMNRANALLASNGETLKAHAEMSASHAAMIAKHGPDMAMDAIKGDFAKIKDDLTKMISDYGSMTDAHRQIGQTIQSAIASVAAPAEEN